MKLFEIIKNFLKIKKIIKIKVYKRNLNDKLKTGLLRILSYVDEDVMKEIDKAIDNYFILFNTDRKKYILKSIVETKEEYQTMGCFIVILEEI